MSWRQNLKAITMTLCTWWAKIMGTSVQPAILMYHSFDTTDWKHGVSPSALQQQLQYVTKHRHVVSLSEMVSYVRKECTLPQEAITITIDDGYADTYEVFFPLAQKYQLSFTLFLTTDLAPQAKLGDLPRPTWAQLQEMHASGLMTVGVHGHTHRNFPEVLADGEETVEIEQCRNVILEKLGVEPVHVAYPAGRHTTAVVDYVRSQNYEAGCLTRAGWVSPGDDLMRLKRIGVDRLTSYTLFTKRLQPGFLLYLSMVKLFNI